MRKYLDIKSAIVHSGLGRTTLYALLNRRAIKAVKYGRRTLILLEDLDALLAGLPPYKSDQQRPQMEEDAPSSKPKKPNEL